jgi:hypothetical protein
MTTMLTYQQRAGRFGREVRGDDDTGTTMENDGGGKAVYVIDADAVAAAIVERLVAGRTLRVP